jgi:hypothetical protein
MGVKRKNIWIGCGLVGALAALVLFVLVALTVRGCSGCISGGPYPLVTETARTDTRIADELGGVVSVGSLPSGSINYMNGEGQAELSLFIDGVARDASYEASVLRPRGSDEWRIVSARLVMDDGTIVALEPPAP